MKKSFNTSFNDLKKCFCYLQQKVKEGEFTPFIVVDGGAAGGGLWAGVFVPTPLLQGVLVLAPGQPHCGRAARSRAFWVGRGVPQYHRTGLAIWGGRLGASHTIRHGERVFNLFLSLKNLLSGAALPWGQFFYSPRNLTKVLNSASLLGKYVNTNITYPVTIRSIFFSYRTLFDDKEKYIWCCQLIT